MTAIAGLKRAHRATWAAGDHAAVAEDIDHVPPAHPLRRVPITLGDNVLDVAAGTGVTCEFERGHNRGASPPPTT